MKKKKNDERKIKGKYLADVIAPLPARKLELPANYAELLNDLKTRIGKTRLKVVIGANREMILLYWEIGNSILKKQNSEGWGAKVIDRLSYDLSKSFPEMKGFSPRNLKYMRAFCEVWKDLAIVQRTVAQLPWRSNITLLEKIENHEERLWYANQAIEHGWSQPILQIQIETKLFKRKGKAANNFTKTLPPPESDMASQIFKDPYLFDFLGTDVVRRESELEHGLVVHIQKFLLELGSGFAFVGRQVHLEVGGDDFYIDLLFYHLRLRCYVVIELKAGKFQAGDAGQLNMYLNIVDEILKHPDDKPTIGLLLVKEKNKLLAEYALRGFSKPIGIAEWKTKMTRSLPKTLTNILPTVEEIEAELYQETNTRTKCRYKCHN